MKFNLQIIFSLLLSMAANAQVNDACLWFDLSIEKKISSKISFDFSQEFRFNENISELGTYYSELGMGYKLNKHLRMSAGYRYINKRNVDDSYSLRHRFFFDATGRYKIKPLSFALRLRYQIQYKDILTSENGMTPSNTLRSRINIKYDFEKKYAPYVYVESYLNMDDDEGPFVDNLRLCSGIEYQLNRMHSFDIYYLLQKEIQVNNPLTEYILGLGYKLTF